MASLFEQMGGTYTQVGDYLIPNLALPAANKNLHIGKYGRMRKEFFKNHRKAFYSRLVITCTLNEYLSEIDAQAKEMLEIIIKDLATKENITEQLKATDQLDWVGKMNNIKNRAEEIVFREMIYK